MVNTEIRLIISFATKSGKALYSQQKQHLHLTVAQIIGSFFAKFRLKLKKVGKTTRPFRYDLNHIPYDYKVEITNRFNGLDLEDRVPEELCKEVYNIVQEVVTKIIPKKCKKAKCFSEEALKIAEKRTGAKGKGEKL